jgi:hypothetical protein
VSRPRCRRCGAACWLYSVLTFLTVFGPGLIVMEADNDAGAVSTYVQAGAQYGTRLLWILMPMTISVRLSLMALRGYLFLMMLLVLYHVMDLAGVFGLHAR